MEFLIGFNKKMISRKQKEKDIAGSIVASKGYGDQRTNADGFGFTFWPFGTTFVGERTQFKRDFHRSRSEFIHASCYGVIYSNGSGKGKMVLKCSQRESLST